MENKKVILHTSPPVLIGMPFQANGILKACLQQSGYKVDSIYWNLSLYKMIEDFLLPMNHTETNILLFFYNYWAVKKRDRILFYRVKALLQGVFPSHMTLQKKKLDDHMHESAQKLDTFLTTHLQELHSQVILYHGFSLHFYQWICVSVIAEKIKELYPDIPVVAGGVGTREVAAAYIRNFKQLDYVIWGEGEDPLLQLTELLSGQRPYDPSSVPGLVFRKGDKTEVSRIKREYLSFDHSYPYADFKDYFDQKNRYGISLPVILPFEASRACHWNRCHFCYLNTGYKYRTKTPEEVVKELRYLMEEYKIYFFTFLDNDIVGRDLTIFNRLLDLLIALRKEYSRFMIHMAEIITCGLDAATIKKMALAGFYRIQFGYESPSANLLKKINKKNTFASNLLFIKYATLYNFQISGANILKNLPEETDEDILEAIDNLYFLRFFLRKNKFSHQFSTLTVCSNSKKIYKKQVNDPSWDFTKSIHPFLPAGLIREEDEIHINEKRYPLHNFLWDRFEQVEKNIYLVNEFSYQLFTYPDGLFYREYQNRVNLLNELDIPYSSLSYDILMLANERVVSLPEIRNSLEDNPPLEEMIEEIDFLVEAGLLYATNDYKEIVTVIHMHLTN